MEEVLEKSRRPAVPAAGMRFYQLTQGRKDTREATLLLPEVRVPDDKPAETEEEIVNLRLVYVWTLIVLTFSFTSGFHWLGVAAGAVFGALFVWLLQKPIASLRLGRQKK